MFNVVVNGVEANLETVCAAMEPVLFDEINQLSFDTDQDFVDAYCRSYEGKYAAEFMIMKG
jgi:hypothetical protein